MAKRYEIIKHNRQEHWIDGSPLLLEVHALVKDNVTGGVLAQCKFQNLGRDTVDTEHGQCDLSDWSDIRTER